MRRDRLAVAVCLLMTGSHGAFAGINTTVRSPADRRGAITTFMPALENAWASILAWSPDAAPYRMRGACCRPPWRIEAACGGVNITAVVPTSVATISHPSNAFMICLAYLSGSPSGEANAIPNLGSLANSAVNLERCSGVNIRSSSRSSFSGLGPTWINTILEVSVSGVGSMKDSNPRFDRTRASFSAASQLCLSSVREIDIPERRTEPTASAKFTFQPADVSNKLKRLAKRRPSKSLIPTSILDGCSENCFNCSAASEICSSVILLPANLDSRRSRASLSPSATRLASAAPRLASAIRASACATFATASLAAAFADAICASALFTRAAASAIWLSNPLAAALADSASFLSCPISLSAVMAAAAESPSLRLLYGYASISASTATAKQTRPTLSSTISDRLRKCASTSNTTSAAKKIRAIASREAWMVVTEDGESHPGSGIHHLIVAWLLSIVFVLRLIDHINKSRGRRK